MFDQHLSDLLKPFFAVDSRIDRNIAHLSLDSRTVTPGTLFLACVGSKMDGRCYVNDAIQRGAAAVVYESDQHSITVQASIPLISFPDLRNKIGFIAAQFYGHPSQSLQVIGATGSNGKTSVTQFLAALYEKLGIRCGVMGTLGNGLYGQLQTGALTTPDAVTLQRLFRDFCLQDAKAVAMEVSSHALDQARVAGVSFTAAVFTNLTRDHLDYHGDMACYGRAKERLFEASGLQHAIVNMDDDFGRALLKKIPRSVSVVGYSQQQVTYDIPCVFARQVRACDQGMMAVIDTPWGNGELITHLLGRFNVANILAVVATLGALGFSITDVLQHVAQLKAVPGRMEVLGGDRLPWVVVDYSHTPDALKNALLALREHCRGRIRCVFGCGGDRDRGKRPLMAEIAEQYADDLIITDDNPRHEDAAAIVAEIIAGLSQGANFSVEHDRKRAIQQAICHAKAGDIVLIAGKGHETYQQIGDQKFPFDDRVVAKVMLDKLRETL